MEQSDIDNFIRDGYLRLDGAFPRELADEMRAILWREMGLDPDEPAAWTKPVVRLGGHAEPPFVAASNTPALHAAFDALTGPGRWAPLMGLGTFPVRFPSPDDPGDAGWHIDVSFANDGDDPNDFLGYRANVNSKGRALLVLFLLSDVAEEDAPTRIRAGSHLDIARRLAPAGEAGMTLRELAANGFSESRDRPVHLATGAAGTVYLCHPFLVHAAQPHRGTRPRFIAQPPLYPKAPLQLDRADGDYSPVERAIRLGLADGREGR